MKKLLIILGVLLLPSALFAGSFEQLMKMPAGKALPKGFVLEGVVISDYRSANCEANPNVAWNRVDLGVNLKTAYLQSADGQHGVKLVFDNIYENRLERYSRISVDLSGCVLTVQKDPKCYTVSGVLKKAVTVLENNVSLPSKKMKVSQLTDKDIYTYVTLEDLEFVDKQGSYCNIFEFCAQPCFINRCDLVWGSADGWATLLEDAQGNPMYMQVNSSCNWRRNNLGVPKGVGAVSGIVVCNQLPRYGGSIGRYSIRPVESTDIAIPSAASSSFSVIASWNLDRNYKSAIRTPEKLSNWHANKGITNCHVLPDEGSGELYCEADCDVLVCDEYDTRHCTDGNGKASRPGAALLFKSLALEWFAGKGIVATVPVNGVNGSFLVLDFSIAAGDLTAEGSVGVPSKWKVLYSGDGGAKYIDSGLSVGLHPLVFRPEAVNSVMVYPDNNEAMGYSQYTVKLPLDHIKNDVVYIKIVSDCKKPQNVPDELPVGIRLGKLEVKAIL